MNFFESQDVAKRNTGKLVFLFVLAVLSLILITNLLVMFVFGFLSTESGTMAALDSVQSRWDVFIWVSVLVTAVILIGSLYKIVSLAGGGSRVAEMMDGRLLIAGSGDFKERRLLNVVEEMAIAAGTPVPPVYLMEETGINAFAAGYSPSDTVIGITRGALDNLSREQLQGVIAHEFSHILHGDMRINIRLIGVLHGIMVLGIIGYFLLRGGSFRHRSKDSGGVVILGLGLLIMGYVGTFFGNLIKSAVSRQREYLADASAVQFTRNPDGIAGALMQIGRHSGRSFLQHPGSNEISHALFEEGNKSVFSRLYATHPPLQDRISAILPDWDGSSDLVADTRQEGGQKTGQEAGKEDSGAEGTVGGAQRATAAIVAGAILGEQLIQQTGNPRPDHLGYANQILQQLPVAVHDAAREPSGARAVAYLLILAQSAAVRADQIALLERSADTGVYAELQRLLPAVDAIRPEHRLPLVEISLPSLRQLSVRQYGIFRSNFDALIQLDSRVDLREWSLQKLLFHHLEAVFDKSFRPRLGRKDLSRCDQAVSVLMSKLVQATRQSAMTPQTAFEKGAAALSFTPQYDSATETGFEELDSALDMLNEVKPLQKPMLLKACVACIEADGTIHPVEIELLRAIAATLDCPMPPLLQLNPPQGF